MNKLLSRYKSTPAPFRASLWFTISNVIQKSIALFSLPILTRIMSTEDYGSYAIYQSWLAVVTILATMNLFLSAYTRGITEFEDQREEFASSILTLCSLITVFLFCVFLIRPEFWSGLMGLSPFLITVMFIEIFLMSAFEFWAATQRYDYKYRALVIVTIAITACSLGLGIAAILSSSSKAEARIIVDVAVKGVVGLLLFILIIGRGKCLFRREFWRYALAFNIPLIPHFLSHFVLTQSDRIMIGSIVGNDAAALYSVTYSLSTAMIFIITAVNNSLTPYTFKCLKAGETDRLKTATRPIFVMVAVLCVLMMAFGPELVTLFASAEYADAIWIMPSLAASVFFIFTYSVFANVEFYYKKTFAISVASAVCALLNIALNYLLIPRFGYQVAAYTTLASYICLTLAHYVLYKRVVSREQPDRTCVYDSRFIFACAVGLLLTVAVMPLLYKVPLLRLGVVAATLTVALLKRKQLISAMKEVR